MVKGQKTRKSRTVKKTKADILTIPQLRKAFDHMDAVVESLRKMSKHSFSDAVIVYREEWRKTFHRDLSPADASAYLKFRFNIKSGKTRRSRTRGGSLPIAGAPLDYSLRSGVNGVYGNFPSYQTEGLDRYYGSAINADCGKQNGFPTDGATSQQLGGGIFGDLGLRMATSTVPPNMLQRAEMDFKGAPPFSTRDPVNYKV